MPFLVLLIVFVSLSYQMFFRFEHWTDRNDPQLVYERDNMTGETHIIHPGDQISLFHRVTGIFPPQNYVRDASQIPQHTLASNSPSNTSTGRQSQPFADNGNPPVPLHELSLPPNRLADIPPEPVNALATNEQSNLKTKSPVPHTKSTLTATKPPEPADALALSAVANPSPANLNAIQPASYQQEKKLDLNQDGQPEKVTLHRAQDGLLDISILQGQQELFYGRGESLQVLSHRNHGWSDISLVIPNEPNQIFTYNPTKHTYEVSRS